MERYTVVEPKGLREDVIVAPATPTGRSAVAVIRVSGVDCHQILKKIWLGQNDLNQSQELPKARQMALGSLFRSQNRQEILDRVLICRFVAPHSYTGEDLFEIYSHGSPFIVQEIIGEILQCGARMADPGEFTRRAFLNGKIDLVQAEAVAQIIETRSKRALSSLQNQVQGHFSRKIDGLRSDLLSLVSWIEADIDFGEREVDDVVPVETLDIRARLAHIRGQTEDLLAQLERGRLLHEGVQIVLVGRPNVGKSSIFNRLCGNARALVDPLPGTTRDYLEAILDLEGIACRLIDTAGLNPKAKGVEASGIERSLDCLKKAHLVLAVFDQSESLQEEDLEFLKVLHGNNAPFWVLLNKNDLAEKISKEELKEALKTFGLSAAGTFSISTRNDEGSFQKFIEKFQKGVLQYLMGGVAENLFEESSSLYLTLRQGDLLSETKEAICRCESALQSDVTHECLALDLRKAISCLSQILGQEVCRGNLNADTDEILGQIFSSFCIGK
jgi:tRNA modification GTPase